MASYPMVGLDPTWNRVTECGPKIWQQYKKKKRLHNHQNLIQNETNNEAEVCLAILSCVSLPTFTEALVLDSEHLRFGTCTCLIPRDASECWLKYPSSDLRPVDASSRRNRKISGFTEIKRFNSRKTPMFLFHCSSACQHQVSVSLG